MRGGWLASIGPLLGGGALAAACGTPADQPVALSYDHVACDHCGMLLSDPRFAAQLVTRDGQRFEFDDPTCAFRYVVDKAPAIAHLWFHDSTRPQDTSAWLDWQQVSFVDAAGAPMNGGLAAVPLGGTPGSQGPVYSFSEASSRAVAPAVPAADAVPPAPRSP